MTLTFGQEHSTVAEKVREGLEYGILHQIDLPPNVAHFTREGPSWIQPPRNFPNSRVLLTQEAQVPDRRELVTGSSRFVGKWIPGMSVMPPS